MFLFITGSGLRSVPESDSPERLCHLQLVRELPPAHVHQDFGQEGGLQLRGHGRHRRLSEEEELPRAGGSGHPARALSHRLRARGRRRRGS